MPEKPTFNFANLTKQDQEDFLFVQKRINLLKNARQTQFGTNIEQIWEDADKNYVPHRIGTKGKRVIATDENKGWRGSIVTLGSSDWQSDISQTNPYVKIQTALAILIDQNPVGIFTPAAKKFQATNDLIKQLYQRSWEFARSKQQLKLFVFNIAKYGWGIARSYPLRITRKVRVPLEFDPEAPAKIKYESKEVIEYNDIFRENLDPWNCWLDDMSKPNDALSLRDWCWRKVYAWDSAEDEFSKYPNWKYVQPGGILQEKVSRSTKADKQFREEKLVEIYFYENRLKDLFMVIANGVPVLIEPLPVSDAKGNKKLSCWHAYWTLRHANCPYGIGLYEAIRYDQALIDRVRNMTIDQLTLSIYKMFFYQGTQALTDTGDITITPGVGKQTLDPKNIKWLEVPGPGQDAWTGLQLFKKDLDDASGISETLEGTITGKTAFEIAQAKEAALKRIKEPLSNILDALETEGYITVSLIDLLYSIPETFSITDPALIDDYLQEIQSDPELYDRDEAGNFIAKVYPEFPLGLETDEEGNLIETQETRFFRVKPSKLKWEGIINIKPQSILTPSKQIDKALELEMYNMLIPLLAQPPELYHKIAKNLVKLYDKDPRDILPESWINPQGQDLMVPQEATGNLPGAPGSPTEAEKLVSRVRIPERPTSLSQKIVQRMAKPLRTI